MKLIGFVRRDWVECSFLLGGGGDSLGVWFVLLRLGETLMLDSCMGVGRAVIWHGGEIEVLAVGSLSLPTEAGLELLEPERMFGKSLL